MNRTMRRQRQALAQERLTTLVYKERKAGAVVMRDLVKPNGPLPVLLGTDKGGSCGPRGIRTAVTPWFAGETGIVGKPIYKERSHAVTASEGYVTTMHPKRKVRRGPDQGFSVQRVAEPARYSKCSIGSGELDLRDPSKK